MSTSPQPAPAPDRRERAKAMLERVTAILSDPLSKETRSDRKTLLGITAFAIMVVKTGLIPTKISTLGIEFSPTDKVMLLKVIAAVIVYFIVAFVVYGITDYLRWLALFRSVLIVRRIARTHEGYPRPAFGVAATSVIRMLFELVFPIVLGIYGIVLLLKAH